jgi:hypothetical protein
LVCFISPICVLSIVDLENDLREAKFKLKQALESKETLETELKTKLNEKDEVLKGKHYYEYGN